MSLAALALFTNAWDSPFIVPVAGCLTGLGIVVANIYSGMRKRELESQERLAAIARGIVLPPPTEDTPSPFLNPVVDGTRRRNAARTGGIVLVGLSVGLVLFFMVLSHILEAPPVLAGAAACLIPLGIGVALLIDARIRTREIESTPPPTDLTR